jgi:hypothetical protein
MAGEEWARRIVEKQLRCPVSINDDGSAPGMYDLRVGQADAPEVAIECVGAVDSIFTETWNVGPAKGPLALACAGDWTVEIAATARVKAVRKHLERLLKELEDRGIHNVNVDYWLKRGVPALFDELDSLGITHASCYRVYGTGKVHLSMPGRGGAVDDKGSEVPKWLGDFLRDPARSDVLSKLQRSGAKDSHAFVIVSLCGVPWAVESYLMGSLDYLPIQAPHLPPPVTAAWIISGFGERGLYWDSSTWQIVKARGDGIDDQPQN